MKNILFIFLFAPLLALSQPNRPPYQYRAAPEKGEWYCIAGMGILALSATAVFTGCKPEVSKTVAYVGGAVISAGVVITLNERGKHKKKKFKRLRVRF